jgi:hypothetical protein
VWSNWEKFCGSQDNPGDSTSYTVPTVSKTNVPVGDLADYFGIPTGLANSITWNNLHGRAMNLIWNQWFRDENLQNAVTVDTGNGPDTYTNYASVLQRGKRHDYFTSCLPWPQKGTAVSLPLGTTAPIISDGAPLKFKPGASGTINYLNFTNGSTTPTWNAAGSATDNAWYGNQGLLADLTNATAATINQLRQSFQIQKLYERDARGGTRYIEVIKSHFGVTSPDARMQRAEYLGGGSSVININPVAQTSGSSITGETTPQGNLAAFATATAHNHGFVKSFTEHCVLIGLVSVRADLNYQQGLNRMFSRQTRWDYYWPALAHIGEQAVLNQEIYAQGTAADTQVFGYQERFADYRYLPSKITGQFRSTYSTPLDAWHLAQKFTSLPSLGSTFIVENPPMSRVLATSGPHFLFDSYIDLKCARPMPVYSVPGMIDHF